jgi:hypothetical protein
MAADDCTSETALKEDEDEVAQLKVSLNESEGTTSWKNMLLRCCLLRLVSCFMFEYPSLFFGEFPVVWFLSGDYETYVSMSLPSSVV